MQIIKKENVAFSEQEAKALNLVMEICTGLVREATDPNLKELAEETYENLAELWEWEE